MKKLTVVLIITALSVFMYAAMVSAGDKGWKNFHGVYEMTAKANGLNSTNGFQQTSNGFYIPNTDAYVWATADVAYGTWTFYRDGTGKAEGMNYAFDFPPGPPGVGPRARDNPFYFEFDYDITRERVITANVTFPAPLTSLEFTGRISQDRKTMTLNNTYTFLGPNTIFMASRVLIWVRDNPEDD